MNPETEKNINEAIDWLQQTGGQIQDFAAEQAPLYCREVVAWEFWIGIAGSLLGAALLLLGGWLVRKGIQLARNPQSSGEEAFPMMLGVVALSVSIGVFCTMLPRTIKAAVAPRLVIVEHLRQLP
jgi:hypothetical protein